MLDIQFNRWTYPKTDTSERDFVKVFYLKWSIIPYFFAWEQSEREKHKLK